MSPKIDSNDLNIKVKNVVKFLEAGNRVKLVVRFRGREMQHAEFGVDILNGIAEQCAEIAIKDKEPKLDGRTMTIVLSPKAAKKS